MCDNCVLRLDDICWCTMYYTKPTFVCTKKIEKYELTRPYSDCKVLGPYKRPDGRQHMIVTFSDGAKSTISYPKYYMECKLGRLLEFNEIVHHKDEDCTNDSPDNFEIKDRVSHGKGHHTKYVDGDVQCSACGKLIWLTVRQQQTLKSNLARGKQGPFCKPCRPTNQYA